VTRKSTTFDNRKEFPVWESIWTTLKKQWVQQVIWWLWLPVIYGLRWLTVHLVYPGIATRRQRLDQFLLANIYSRSAISNKSGDVQNVSLDRNTVTYLNATPAKDGKPAQPARWSGVPDESRRASA
jgi:hypothetical protein